jgi:FkbM family methyltransferase
MNRWLGFARSFVIYHNPAAQMRWRQFYRQALPPGALAFDIGAHMGTRARAMRAAGARVVAVEPQAPFTGYLRRSLPRDITVLDVALGAADGMAELAVSSRHPTVSSLNSAFVDKACDVPGFNHVDWDARQSVTVTTLDTLIAEHGRPDYIKIDVEGHEASVLDGLSQPITLISVEYLPAFPQLSHVVIDRLCVLGPYRFNAVEGETGRYLWSEWKSAEDVKEWLAMLDAQDLSGDLFARIS